MKKFRAREANEVVHVANSNLHLKEKIFKQRIKWIENIPINWLDKMIKILLKLLTKNPYLNHFTIITPMIN